MHQHTICTFMHLYDKHACSHDVPSFLCVNVFQKKCLGKKKSNMLYFMQFIKYIQLYMCHIFDQYMYAMISNALTTLMSYFMD